MPDFASAVAEVRQRKVDQTGGAAPAVDPMQSAVQKVLASRDTQLKASVLGATQQNPDEAAKDLELSRKSGLPVDVVREQRDRVRAEQDYADLNVDQLKTTNPKLAETMRDPAVAAVVRDDVENMSWFERFTKGTAQSFEQGTRNKETADIGFKMLLRQQLTPSEQLFLNRNRNTQEIDYQLGFFSGIPGAVAEMTPLLADQTIDSLPYAAVGATGGAAVGAGTGAAAGAPVGGVGAIPGAIAGASRGAWTGGRYGFTAGMTINVMKTEAALAMVEYSAITDDQGKTLDYETALGASLAVGMVNGALEKVGLDNIFARIPGGDKFVAALGKGPLREALTQNPAARQFFRRFGTQIVKSGLVEAMTEGAQESVTAIAGELAKAASDLNLESFQVEGSTGEFWSQLAQRSGEAAYQGAQGGIGFTAASGVAQTAFDAGAARVEAQRAEAAARRVKEMAAQSKVLVRDPQTFKSQVQKFAQDTGADRVFIQADKITEAFANDPEAYKRLAAEVPDLNEKMSEALTRGGDVEIPLEDFAAAVGKSNDFDSLIPSVRFDPEAMAMSDPIEEQAQQLADELGDQSLSGTQDLDAQGIVRSEEGERLKAYKDTVGKTTVGVGFNMQQAGAKELWDEAGIPEDFDAVLNGTAEISAASSRKLFDFMYGRAEEAAARVFPGYESLGAYQRAGLVSMIYQLGEAGTAEFENTLKALKKGDSGKVEAGILNSLLAQQTPERAKRLAQMLAYNQPGTKLRDSQGFDTATPLYRGVTSPELMDADPNKQPDANKFGSATYLARDPKLAADYAGGQNGTMAKYYGKLDKGFDAKGRVPAEEARALIDAATGGPEAADKLIGTKSAVEGRVVYAALGADKNRANKILQDNGYDHIVYGDEVAVFDKNRVRNALQVFNPILEDPTKIARAEGLDGPELDLVSERIQTVEKELMRTRQALRYQPDARITELMTNTEREAYLKQSDKTLQDAHEKMLRSTISEVKKRRTQEYKDAKVRMTAQVTKQLEGEPVYQALSFVQQGKVPTDLEGIINPEVRKLWRRDVEAVIGSEAAAKLPRGVWARTKEESAGLDVLASAFGYGSGRDMLEAMVDTPALSDNAERIVQTQLDAEYGNLEDVTERAVEEMHNTAASKALDAEYQALAKAAKVTPVPREAFERAAKRYISGLKVDVATKPDKYRRAEVRAAREAGLALGKKDYVKAAEWKRKQSINHYLYKEAARIRSEVDSALPKFRSYMKKPTKETAKRMDVDYLAKAQEILGRFIFGPRMSQRRELVLEMYAFDQWIKEKQVNDAAQLLLPQEIADVRNKAHFTELTVDEFRGLRDNVENIVAQARLKTKLMRNKKERELNEVAAEVAQTIRANRAEQNIPEGQETAFERLGDGVRGYIGTLLRAETIVRELDGFKELGPVWQNLFADIKAAGDRKASRQRKMSREVENLFKRYYQTGELEAMNKKLYKNPNGKPFSKSDLLSVALNMGNETNKQALFEQKAHKWTEASVNKALEQLDERDFKFVQDAWDYIDGFWPEVAMLEKRRTGVIPERVEPTELKTKFGTLRGGYYPLRYDPKTSAAAARDAVKDMSELARAGMFGRSMTSRTHTKARVGSNGRGVKLGFDVMFSHLNEVVHDLEMGEAVEQTYRLLNHGKVTAALEETGGLNLKNFMDLWLADVAAGDLPAIDTISRVLTRLRGNVSIAAMGWKMSTALVQLTGFTQTVAALGVPETINGILKTYAHGNPKEIGRTIQWVMNKSEFMRNRTQTFNRDIADIRKRMQVGGRLTPITDSYFWMIAKMQVGVDVPTWIGAYEKGLKQFSGDDTKAVQFADQLVRRAQSSGMMEDLSAIERGTLNQRVRGDAAVKLWTVFYTYFNTKFNLAYEKYKTTDFTKPRDVAKFTADMGVLFLVEAMLGDLLLGRAPSTDDEGEDWLSWAVRLGLTNVAATMPGIRETANAAFTVFGGGPAGGRAFEQIGNTVKQIGQADFDEALVKSLNTTGGLLFGYPASQLNVAIDALWALENGEDVTPLDFVLYRPEK